MNFPSIKDIYSGTYTPTATAISNITSITELETLYIKIGDIVTVSGQMNIDPTSASTLTELYLSLPIDTNFTSVVDASGSITSSVGNNGKISANASEDKAIMQFIGANAANSTYAFTFQYRIK